jgi:hypothetical protein
MCAGLLCQRLSCKSAAGTMSCENRVSYGGRP